MAAVYVNFAALMSLLWP